MDLILLDLVPEQVVTVPQKMNCYNDKSIHFATNGKNNVEAGREENQDQKHLNNKHKVLMHNRFQWKCEIVFHLVDFFHVQQWNNNSEDHWRNPDYSNMNELVHLT